MKIRTLSAFIYKADIDFKRNGIACSKKPQKVYLLKIVYEKYFF